MVAPIGSISMCKHRASERASEQEREEYPAIKPAECFSPRPQPQLWHVCSRRPPSLFYARVHIQVFSPFTRTHRQEHAPLRSIVHASLKASLTGLFCLWVYYSWDVSLFCQKAISAGGFRSKDVPRPGDVSSILFSHPSNTVSPLAFYLPHSSHCALPAHPLSLRCSVLFPASQLLLLSEPSSLRETLVHGRPHLPSALPFN